MTAKWLILANFVGIYLKLFECESTDSRNIQGCQKSDHEDCDELCKSDVFWYGICISWDSEEMECQCYEYPSHLDPLVCTKPRKKLCNDVCLKLRFSWRGGFCYPHIKKRRMEARCMCFDQKEYTNSMKLIDSPYERSFDNTLNDFIVKQRQTSISESTLENKIVAKKKQPLVAVQKAQDKSDDVFRFSLGESVINNA